MVFVRSSWASVSVLLTHVVSLVSPTEPSGTARLTLLNFTHMLGLVASKPLSWMSGSRGCQA